MSKVSSSSKTTIIILSFYILPIDFRGELLWYQPVFKFVELFLGAVSDVSISFFGNNVVLLSKPCSNTRLLLLVIII